MSSSNPISCVDPREFAGEEQPVAIVRPQSDWHLLDPDVLIWLIQSKPRHEFIAKLIEIRVQRWRGA